MKAYRDRGEGQDIYGGQTKLAIQFSNCGIRDLHEDLENAPAESEVLDSSASEAQARREEEEEEPRVDRAEGSRVEVESVQRGLLEVEVRRQGQDRPRESSAQSDIKSQKVVTLIQDLKEIVKRYSHRESVSSVSQTVFDEYAVERVLEDDLQIFYHDPAERKRFEHDAAEYSQAPDECVQLSCQDVARYCRHVPSEFVVPENSRLCLQLQDQQWPLQADMDIPVISLMPLMAEEMASEEEIFLLKCHISEACREWGVFQVLDHGIPRSVLESALHAARGFFNLHEELKMRYSFSQYLDGSGYGGWKSIHARNWGDKVLHVLHVDKTLEENDLPEQPPSYGEIILKYAKLVMVMHMQLIDACAQIQDVDVTDLEAALKEECLNILSKSYSTPPQDTLQQSFSIDRRAATVYDVGSSTSDAGRAEIHEDEDKYTDAMALSVNYHPPCPHPELVLGSEPCFARCPFEIVLQNEVLGLQVFKEGRWRTLKPEPDALVVIVGKALENVSKDMVSQYKAVMFRTLSNKEKDHFSIHSAHGVYVDSHVNFHVPKG
ncbi:hypothetical protein AXG93_669s1200 [Marchantia polymorpha subsp. ruderalis]|nr:hypothetical protein AXG93_669s1200 [Marchantia polymorpha subsp. ruderalis]